MSITETMASAGLSGIQCSSITCGWYGNIDKAIILSARRCRLGKLYEFSYAIPAESPISVAYPVILALAECLHCTLLRWTFRPHDDGMHCATDIRLRLIAVTDSPPVIADDPFTHRFVVEAARHLDDERNRDFGGLILHIPITQ